jgi:hypothetical protein
MTIPRRVVCVISTVAALAGFFPGAGARADALSSPWGGASADTTVFDHTDSHSGPTAGASGSDTRAVTYEGRTYTNSGVPLQYQVTVNGSAHASATGEAANLLNVQTHYYGPNPGSLGYVQEIPGPVNATARWTNDVLTVTPPPGATTPDAVRLDLALKFTTPPNPNYDPSFGSMTVTADGRQITITPPIGWYGLPYYPKAFDSLTTSADGMSVGTFHLDLPLDRSGASAPFQLALSSNPNARLQSNAGAYVDQSASLSLQAVTLPDGTPLASKGYGVSFASGMLGTPSTVPEPAPLACWGLASGAAALLGLARRRRGGGGRRPVE